MKKRSPHTTEFEEKLAQLWWQFFDWVAVVPWPKMAGICFAAVFIAWATGLPAFFYLLVMGTIAMKVLAGGKRQAEVAAKMATKRADVEALERRLLEAQIAALQAQVEPHFLFNTLALIGQLIETDPPEAARIHKHLIEYLRAAVPQMRRGGSTLGEQFELSRAYLNIMQARMKERLRMSLEIPEALKQATFPPMMLQSLVENAIKHGLEPKITGGEIQLRGRRAGNELIVEVTDTGVGFSPQAKDGVGLANLRERLKVLYGERAQLVIEIPPQGGTRVAIHLPFSLPN